MNRERCYRAWNKLKSKFNYYVEIYSYLDGSVGYSAGVRNNAPIGITTHFVLQDFTGLYDSTKWEELNEVEQDEWIKGGNTVENWKGKKIFEGDLFIHNEALRKIVYRSDKASYFCETVKKNTNKHDFYLREAYNIKIIGNIFEHKHLLDN